MPATMGYTPGNTRNARGGAALAAVVENLYAQGQTDYSLEPVVLQDATGHTVGRVMDGDAVVFCCRRGEREIQLTEAFTDPNLDHFPREPFTQLPFVILTLYHDKFKDLPVAFAPAKVQATLGEAVSLAGLSQARISESEKFAHVTFFMNGGNNRPYPLEEDIRIPSLRGVPFEQHPQLSLEKVARAVIDEIHKGTRLIVTNFANGDVIGHTANRAAKIACVQHVDLHLRDTVEQATAAGYVVIITADHGNLEELVSADGTPHVSHTTNPVPCFIIDAAATKAVTPRQGRLADIAPTVLRILNIVPPAEMCGENLAPDHNFANNRKVVLIILDGWGIGPNPENDPIAIAETPFWDHLLALYPHSQLQASGEAVGLKPGKAGNSEAGHMNIGAGRVILQDDVRLDKAMRDGSFYTNEVICGVIEGVKERGKSLHLIGLLTEKSSHGSMEYPLAVLKMAKDAGLERVFLHMIFDGRSTEPGSAPALLAKLEALMNEIGLGQIVTGIGRGIALDRDGNYHKTQIAYDALVYGKGRGAGI